MAIRSVVMRGYGNGTFSPGVAFVPRRGYAASAVAATLGLIETSIVLRNSLALSDTVRNTITLSIALVNTLEILDTLRNSIAVQIALLGSVAPDDFGDS